MMYNVLQNISTKLVGNSSSDFKIVIFIGTKMCVPFWFRRRFCYLVSSFTIFVSVNESTNVDICEK